MESSSRHQSRFESLGEHEEDKGGETDEEGEEMGLGKVLNHEAELVGRGFEDRVSQESLQSQDGDELRDSND